MMTEVFDSSHRGRPNQQPQAPLTESINLQQIADVWREDEELRKLYRDAIENVEPPSDAYLEKLRKRLRGKGIRLDAEQGY